MKREQSSSGLAGAALFLNDVFGHHISAMNSCSKAILLPVVLFDPTYDISICDNIVS